MAEPSNLIGNVNDPARSTNLLGNVNERPTPLMLANTRPTTTPTTNRDPLAGVSQTARSLYVDPTPAFQAPLNFIEQQRAQANERYAQNKADIANIFGTLTQVNQESQNRVNNQFAQSIANQQLATAQRVAEARAGQQATQQSALRAMDERGGGPMGNLAASPANVAAERGIADINAYQQIFQGQQGAIQQQTQQDLQAALRGLGFQQTEANRGLQRSLEDTLLGLSGQEANIRGELAGAKIAGRQQARQANYQEILQKQANDAAARMAALKASNQPREYSRGATGIFERIADQAGAGSARGFSQSIAKILGGADASGPGKPKAPTSLSEAMQRWIRANPGMDAYQGYAADVFADIFSKSIPAAPRTAVPGQRPSLLDSFGQG